MPADACVPVVLNSWYTRSRLHEGSNTAYVQLYVGKEKLLDWQQPDPQELTADLSAPTWIGRDSDGKKPWQARLGTPQVYNTALTEDPTVPFDQLTEAQKAACSEKMGSE
jgi:hypothetical protein